VEATKRFFQLCMELLVVILVAPYDVINIGPSCMWLPVLPASSARQPRAALRPCGPRKSGIPESVEIPAPVSTATVRTSRAYAGTWPGAATASARPSVANAPSSRARNATNCHGSRGSDNAAQLAE
jgi:hypothetical protein